MRNKSGNQSLLSNGVARTHFMPPDGACILTVLKPLQSLTGGSRLDALAKSAPDKSSRNQCAPAPREKGLVFSALSVFEYLYLRYFLYITFSDEVFSSAQWARATSGSYPSKNVSYHALSDRAENFDPVFSRNK
jgi:hypothetical protein